MFIPNTTPPLNTHNSFPIVTVVTTPQGRKVQALIILGATAALVALVAGIIIASLGLALVGSAFLVLNLSLAYLIHQYRMDSLMPSYLPPIGNTLISQTLGGHTMTHSPSRPLLDASAAAEPIGPSAEPLKQSGEFSVCGSPPLNLETLPLKKDSEEKAAE